MARTIGAAVGLVLLLSIGGGAVAAADLQTATEAYQRGDFSAAFGEFQELASNGDSDGMLWLGYLYQEGQGTQQNYDEALRYYRMAADMENIQAYFYVGNCYYYGYGVEKDFVESVRWYRRSADQGNAGAQFAMGYAYENGEGAPRDRPAARRWYQAAADQGNSDAISALQRMAPAPE